MENNGKFRSMAEPGGAWRQRLDGSRWSALEHKNGPEMGDLGTVRWDDPAPFAAARIAIARKGQFVQNNTVVSFSQPDEPLPHPPTSPNITLRRSIGLTFDPVEVRTSSLFRQRSRLAKSFQIDVMLASWLETPAGSLPNDAELIHALVQMAEDKNSWRDFSRHRATIMRGWYLCRNGLLYHPFVARQVERCWLARRRRD